MGKELAIKVLIIEDELIVALNLSKELAHEGYRVLDLATNEAEAVSIAKSDNPNIILMDINLENGGSGISAAKQIREFCPSPIIYLTAYSSDRTIELVGQTNPYGYTTYSLAFYSLLDKSSKHLAYPLLTHQF